MAQLEFQSWSEEAGTLAIFLNCISTGYESSPQEAFQMDKSHPRNHKLRAVLMEMLYVKAKSGRREDKVVVGLRTVSR